MESKQKPYYVTEKILNAFEAGSIPIYWGDSIYAKELFNQKAFIDASKFSSMKELAEYIYKIKSDPKKLLSIGSEPVFKDNIVPEIFKWRTKNTSNIMEAADYLRIVFFNRVKFK